MKEREEGNIYIYMFFLLLGWRDEKGLKTFNYPDLLLFLRNLSQISQFLIASSQ